MELCYVWRLTLVKEFPLARDPRWATVHWHAVYVLRDGGNRFLAPSGYRILRHLTPMSAVLDLAVRGQRVEDLTHAAGLAFRRAPSSPRAAFFGAFCGAEAERWVGIYDGPVERLGLLSPNDRPVSVLERAWIAATR